jgi:hypothetical protein
MPGRVGWGVLIWLLCGAWGCSSTNPDVRVRRLRDGRLQVEGPLLGPFKTEEDMAEAACKRMTSQPGASNGAYGSEYCALHYYANEDEAFFLSYLSNVGGTAAGGAKYCEIPRALLDLEHKDVVILGGAHTHPHNRQFSKKDMSIRAHWLPVRFVDPSTRQIWDRQLMMFLREKTGECGAYIYNNATRVISSLREGKWVPIARAYNDDGDVEMLEGKDWLP